MRVSVIVPARDARATLRAALDALAAQALDDSFEVVVVDDASTDDTRALAEAHPVVTRVVAGAGNGPGAARNVGVRESSGAVIAFTDADCEPDPGWLHAGLRALETADLVQGRVEPAGPVGPFDRTVRVGQLTDLFETANLLVEREWFERVGGFEPWLSPKRSKELGEDVWLGWRLRRAGARIAFAPDALVRHAVFPGTPASFVAEKARLRFFPEMAARIPELRDSFFHRRYFLTKRTAAFDLALAGVAATAVTGLPEALLVTLPYARHVWRAARPHGRGAPIVAAASLAGEIVGAAALVVGSVRARSPLL